MDLNSVKGMKLNCGELFIILSTQNISHIFLKPSFK